VGKKVWHLQPWFSKDLMIRPLADRLSDLPQLTFLNPNMLKDEVFGKYYTMRGGGSANQDYVRTSIAATVLMENLKFDLLSLSLSLSETPRRLIFPLAMVLVSQSESLITRP